MPNSDLIDDCVRPLVTLALSQTAACQVILDFHCPGGNKRVAEAVGQ